MKPRKALLPLLLVVMVITDSASGDSLSSLLKRRKKITTTSRPEIQEEIAVENKKLEPDLSKSQEVTNAPANVADVQVKQRENPVSSPIEPNVSTDVSKTFVPVRRKFGKGKVPYRRKKPVEHTESGSVEISPTEKPLNEVVIKVTTERINESKTTTPTVVSTRRKFGKGNVPQRKKDAIIPKEGVQAETSERGKPLSIEVTEKPNLSKKGITVTTTEKAVRRKFGNAQNKREEPVVHKEDVHSEVSTRGKPLSSIEVTEIPTLSKEVVTVTTTTERPVRRKFGKGSAQNKRNEPIVHKEEVKEEISERRKTRKSKRPKPAGLNKSTEIKYIPLVDDNGDDIKLAASESVEHETQQVLSVETSSSVEGTPSLEVSQQEVDEDMLKKEMKQKNKKVPKQKIVEIKVEETPAPPEIPENKDRVVTEFMLFRTGVPVDYSYNETADNPGDIVSSSGCPKSIDGYPWVLYEDASSETKCYLVGQHSLACHGSAVMNYQRGSEYGVCACNFQECLVKRNMPLNPTSSPDLNGNQLKRRTGLPGKLRYRFCRPMGVNCEEFVYDQKEKRCDIMYSQGPCKKNEWLQRNSKGGVECAQRLCDSGSGLSEKSEEFQRSFGNVTEENAECCKPWGGFAVAGVLTRLSTSACEPGQIYSKALKKCLPPFKLSSLIVG